jgi:hypothetical protein
MRRRMVRFNLPATYPTESSLIALELTIVVKPRIDYLKTLTGNESIIWAHSFGTHFQIP